MAWRKFLTFWYRTGIADVDMIIPTLVINGVVVVSFLLYDDPMPRGNVALELDTWYGILCLCSIRVSTPYATNPLQIRRPPFHPRTGSIDIGVKAARCDT